MRNLVLRWDRAKREHDLRALGELYAISVGYYTVTLDRAGVLEQLAKYFSTHQEFSQAIANLRISKRDSMPGYLATFSKIVTSRRGTQTFDSYLVVDSVEEEFGGDPVGWRVVMESDLLSDSASLARLFHIDPARFKSCEDVVRAIVLSSPEIRQESSTSIILDLDRYNDGAYGFHLYYEPPLSGFTMTVDWPSFDSRSDVLTDKNGKRLQFDSTLLPYLKKYCH